MSATKTARSTRTQARKDAAIKAAPVGKVAKGKTVTEAPTAKGRAARIDAALESVKERHPAKAAKAAKVTPLCLCCGQSTKGGRFLPGHDARFAGMLVKQYTEALVAQGPIPAVTRLREDLARTAQDVSPAFAAKVAKGMDLACATA